MKQHFDNREFRVWLDNNYHHLESYTMGEISRLATACGFHLIDICYTLVDWIAYRPVMRRGERHVTPLWEQWAMLQMHQLQGWDWDYYNKGDR